jgi:transcriptional regulator with XRE-family HTH domain
MIRAIDKEALALLGARIKEVRKIKKMSQEQLAYSADISLSQLSRIESGKHNTSISSISAMCKAFNITLMEFFTDVNYPLPVKPKAKKK